MGSPALDAVKGKTSTPVQPIRRQPVEEKPVVTPEQIATKKAEEAQKDVVIGTALLKGSTGENIRASIPAVTGNFISNNIWKNNPQRNIQNNNQTKWTQICVHFLLQGGFLEHGFLLSLHNISYVMKLKKVREN